MNLQEAQRNMNKKSDENPMQFSESGVEVEEPEFPAPEIKQGDENSHDEKKISHIFLI